MRLRYHLKQFLRLPTDQPINPEVRLNFKHNFFYNSMDVILWIMGESFVSANTILPVFASNLTNSPLIIGLVPAVINAGWFIPQLLMAGYVQRLPQKMPFARLMAIIERMPYILLPLSAYLINWLPGDLALIFFFVIIGFRGIASGMVALPWQEVIARVVPSPVRSRFFGFSRTIGRIMGVIGSIITGFILTTFAFPNNYALSFLIGGMIMWSSFLFFTRTIEPKPNLSTNEHKLVEHNSLKSDFQSYKNILSKDQNFRRYLTSRSIFQLSGMAIAFLAVFGIQSYGLSDEQAAIFTGIISLSSMSGFLLFSFIGDRLGPRKILLFSDGLQAIILLLAIINPGLWSIYAIFLILGFTQSGYIIGELIIVMELGTEDQRPIYIGLARTLPGLIILIAPMIGGVIVSQFGYTLMFVVALILSIGGSVLLLGVRDRKHASA